MNVSGLATGLTFLSNISNEHTCAVTSAGGIKCWGLNFFGQLGMGQTTVQPTPTDVVNVTSGATWVTTGFSHTCAVVSGTVQC